MTKNPILNAIAALAYIVIVSSVMFYAPKIGEHGDDSVFAPIAVLSLFTLSAAFMAYVFFYQPFQLYFDGKKKQAIELAFKSFVSFAAVTVIVLALLFSGVLS